MHLSTIFVHLMRLAAAISVAGAIPSFGAVLSSNAIQDVRAEMRRKLSDEERSAYRGITMSAMTGTKFERLIKVTTAEEIIISELYGKQFIPSDDPQNVYLVSAGRGITAQYNSDYIAKMFEADGPGRVSNMTMSEMDAEYRNKPSPFSPEEERTKLEEVLHEVAAEFLAWADKEFGQSKLLSRQQGYYCKSQRQYCGRSTDCAKTRTIRPTFCVCSTYDTCKTEYIPLPPYPCEGCKPTG